MHKIDIPSQYNNIRADIVLAKILNISRSSLKNRLLNNIIYINGKKRSLSYPVHTSDTIEFSLKDKPSLNARPQDIPLSILYEDNDLLVINKQPDLVVHAGGGTFENTLVNGILFHFNLQQNFKDQIRPGIVHRLDKDTSGVMIIAKNEKCQYVLQNQFANRQIQKEYRAITFDNFHDDSMVIDTTIGRDPIHRKQMKINGLNPKNSLTNISVITRFGNYTYVSAFPKTGRTHQIRVHLSSINHPIIGDKIYAHKKDLKFGSLTVKRQMLHAFTISFLHPSSLEPVCFKAPLPKDMTNLLNKLEQQISFE